MEVKKIPKSLLDFFYFSMGVIERERFILKLFDEFVAQIFLTPNDRSENILFDVGQGQLIHGTSSLFIVSPYFGGFLGGSSIAGM